MLRRPPRSTPFPSTTLFRSAHLTQPRREATYYGAFALAAGVGPAFAALLLPLIFERFGYTVAQPLGVQLVFAGAGLMALLGAAVFWGYQLGDTLAESLQNMERN